MAEQLVFSAAYWEMPEFWEIKAIFQISSDIAYPNMRPFSIFSSVYTLAFVNLEPVHLNFARLANHEKGLIIFTADIKLKLFCQFL